MWLFSFEKETWRSLLLKYVKARSGKEVAHMPHSGQARPQQTGAQIKLYLVMGVDEIKRAVAYGKVLRGQTLEHLYRTTRLFDVKQFVCNAWFLVESPQYGRIYIFWQ